jgi:hypothetical protein
MQMLQIAELADVALRRESQQQGRRLVRIGVAEDVRVP